MNASERGEVSITSVLVACTLLVVVLGSTLTLFEGFIAKAGDAARRTDSQDAARTAADRIARNLRNLANPTPDDPQAVDRATGTDLIFKTVNPAGPAAVGNATNTQRVRYCLDERRQQLQQQTQTWAAAPPPPPADTACPGAGWTHTRIAATGVVNTTEPVFTYDDPSSTVISGVHVDLLVDADVSRPPGATRLSTGVFLRNQNRRPQAAFSVTSTSGGFVLNGSASRDDDLNPLRFTWYDDSVSPPVLLGTGITFTYTGLFAGTYRLRLVVSDPAGLTSTSTQEVTA